MSKETGKRAASKASAIMRNPSASSKAKSAAASALSQRGTPKKVTSQPAASKASSTLRNPRTSSTAKSAAASALSQTPRRRGR